MFCTYLCPMRSFFGKKNRKNIWPFKKNVVTLQRFRRERALSSAGSERLPYKQRVGGSNPSAPTKFFHFSHEGRLAQLVQSVCLTSRGSGVRIPQRPPNKTHHGCDLPRNRFYLYIPHGVGWRSLRDRGPAVNGRLSARELPFPRVPAFPRIAVARNRGTLILRIYKKKNEKRKPKFSNFSFSSLLWRCGRDSNSRPPA